MMIAVGVGVPGAHAVELVVVGSVGHADDVDIRVADVKAFEVPVVVVDQFEGGFRAPAVDPYRAVGVGGHADRVARRAAQIGRGIEHTARTVVVAGAEMDMVASNKANGKGTG